MRTLVPQNYNAEAGVVYLWLLTLLEKSILSRLLLLALLALPVLVVRHLLEQTRVNSLQVDFCGCGNDITGVEAADGDTVDLEGATAEKKAAF